MKLFSFKKKKPANLAARESKKQQKAVQVEERRGMVHRDDTKGGEQKQREVRSMPTPKMFGDASRVIMRPRITEKGTDLAADHNAYAFEVDPRATKRQIAEGVHELYGVTPEKIRIIKIPTKRVRGRRGKAGTTGGGKKVYVYLKDGDSIEFV